MARRTSAAIENQLPLALVIVLLGTNDFQSMHAFNAWHSPRHSLARARDPRRAIEPGMPVPPVLIVAPPPVRTQEARSRRSSTVRREGQGSRRRAREGRGRARCPFVDAGKIASTSTWTACTSTPISTPCSRTRWRRESRTCSTRTRGGA